MTHNEINPLHFIPIGRVIADPMELSAAVSMAIFGQRGTDTDLSFDREGNPVLGMFNPRTGGRDYLRPGDDHIAGQEFTIMLVHGGVVLGEAMRNGELEAFVISNDGRYLRVPRFYWFKVNPSTSTALEQIETGHVPSDLVGSPLLVDPAHIEKWSATIRPAVEDMVQRTREARGDKIVQLKPQSSPRGPDPYKHYPMLERVFRAHDNHLSNLKSDRARHRHLVSIWKGVAAKLGREKCPSYEVVRRCWQKYKL